MVAKQNKNSPCHTHHAGTWQWGREFAYPLGSLISQHSLAVVVTMIVHSLLAGKETQQLF